MLENLAAWLQQTQGIDSDLQRRIAGSLATILLLWIARRLVLAVVERRVNDPRMRYRWQKTTTWVSAPIALMLVGRIWFEGIQSLATFLGLVSAGIAIALKDLVANLAGWGFILWRRPFEVGDRIEIGPWSGDVIDVRIFQFSLLEIGNWVDADQSTGRIVHVPNGKVLGEPLANYSRGMRFVWDELHVTVTFESDWQKAKQLLEEIVQRRTAHLATEAERQLKAASSQFLLLPSALTPAVYTSVVESGVRLTMRYLAELGRRRAAAQDLWEDALRAFSAAEAIELAYPTQRFFDRNAEGAQRAPARPAKVG